MKKESKNYSFYQRVCGCWKQTKDNFERNFGVEAKVN